MWNQKEMRKGREGGGKHDLILFKRLELQSSTYKAGGGLSTITYSLPNSRHRLLGAEVSMKSDTKLIYGSWICIFMPIPSRSLQAQSSAFRECHAAPCSFIPILSNPISSNKRCRCPISSNFFLMQIIVYLLFEYPIKSFDGSLECLVVPRGSLSVL